MDRLVRQLDHPMTLAVSLSRLFIVLGFDEKKKGSGHQEKMSGKFFKILDLCDL